MKTDMHYHDMDDVTENPYRCPKARDMEALLDRADYLRDEQKDREWEAALEAADARRKQEAFGGDCRHGNNQTECSECEFDADIAFDAAREG